MIGTSGGIASTTCNYCDGTGMVLVTPPNDWSPVMCLCSACHGSGKRASTGKDTDKEATK